MKWDELSGVAGQNVSIVMPHGAVVTGKVSRVEADGLVMNVARTTDPAAYPKGNLRVARAGLRTIEIRRKGHKFRVIGTALGFVAGVTGGAAAAIGVQGGLFSNNNQGKAAATFAGIIAGATVGGYLIGNAADRKSVTVEVVP